MIYRQQPVTLLYVQAGSFPQGIMAAFQKLESLKPDMSHRKFYGISFMHNGQIIYRAAAEEAYSGEGAQLGVETFEAKAGLYVSERVNDFMSDPQSIQHTFDRLLADPRIDEQGYCLEEYIGGKDVVCMVPLDKALVQQQDRLELQAEISACYDAFMTTLEAFNPAQVNKVPFEGSWTAGQLAEHIIRAPSWDGEGTMRPIDRLYYEQVDLIRSHFLDFSIKFQSPDFILPEKTHHDKTGLLNALEQIKETHLRTIQHKDLHAQWIDFEMPVYGFLTRFELLKLNIVHVQRHTNQLQRIFRALQQEEKTVRP